MTKARTNADNVAGDIAGITAGTGITGGGTSGTVTITNDMATQIAAKGDLVVGTGNDTYTNVTVGSNNQTILADSAQTTGIKWAASPTSVLGTTGDILYASSANTLAALAAGTSGYALTANGAGVAPSWQAVPTGGMTLISETTASALSSLSLSSIPSTYKHLLLVWDGLYHSTTVTGFDIRLNNDSTSNYPIVGVQGGLGQSAFTANSALGTGISATNIIGTTWSVFGYDLTTSSTTYEQMGTGVLEIFNYSSASKYKQYRAQMIGYKTASTAGGISIVNGIYKSTTAISSIDVFRTTGTATFSNAANTSIRLYGVS